MMYRLCSIVNGPFENALLWMDSGDPKKLKRFKRVLEISDILDIIRTFPVEFFIYSVILSEFKNVFNPHCPANLLFSSIIRSYSCLFMTN